MTGGLRHRGKEQPHLVPKQADTVSKSPDPPKGSFFSRVLSWLWDPIDPTILALFRICWGLVMAYEGFRYIYPNDARIIKHFYSNPWGFNFKYWPFHWVQKFEDPEHMKLMFLVMTIAGFFIFLGFLYRLCAVIYFFCVTYMFYLEATTYLNHIYLVIVLSFVMIFLPCNAVLSIDALLLGKSQHVSRISLFFIRALIIVVYTYAGFVKLNEDWLRGEPLRFWLHGHSSSMAAWLAPFSNWLRYDSAVYFFAYGGIVYDLTVGALLCFQRTFWMAIAASLFFHIVNKMVMNIGIFPYVMISSTALFFRDSTMGYLIHCVKKIFSRGVEEYKPISVPFKNTVIRKLTVKQKILTSLAVIFMIWWIFFPLRHYIYPDEVVWTDFGHNYSWRMKLRDRECDYHVFGYQPIDKKAGLFLVPTFAILRGKQVKVFQRPWTVIQYAHWLGDIYAKNGTRAQIYFYAYCDVNYRGQPQKYINFSVDLASAPMWTEPYEWIYPLQPMKKSLYSGYPWHWEWNFNWLKGNETSNDEVIKAYRKDRERRIQEYGDRGVVEFKRMIAKKYFKGKEEVLGEIQYEAPPQPGRQGPRILLQPRNH